MWELLPVDAACGVFITTRRSPPTPSFCRSCDNGLADHCSAAVVHERFVSSSAGAFFACGLRTWVIVGGPCCSGPLRPSSSSDIHRRAVCLASCGSNGEQTELVAQQVDDLEDLPAGAAGALEVERDLAEELLVLRRQSIGRTRLALARIDDETYGACQECHRAIPIERLEVIPHAQLCVTCRAVPGQPVDRWTELAELHLFRRDGSQGHGRDIGTSAEVAHSHTTETFSFPLEEVAGTGADEGSPADPDGRVHRRR